jgi:ankyrin repeat protein
MATTEAGRQAKAILMIGSYIEASNMDPASALMVQTTTRFRTNEKRHRATVLHVVCEQAMLTVFDYTLSLCSDPAFLDLTMDDGATALFLAQLRRKSLKKTADDVLYMTKRLVECGADVFLRREEYGANPLYIACECGNLQSCKFLYSSMLTAKGITEDNYTEDAHKQHMEAIVYRGKGKH